jgi:acetyl esterase/lipase
MTVYSPEGKNTGVAMVVFPGGGYWILAIDLEGTEVCDWLTAKGITAILLKYRVPGHPQKSPRSGPYPDSPEALEDAQRALGLVRFHAAEWHIDPHKIGVIGFSAGGHLVAAMSTHFEQRLYKPVDEADKESCRPDFAVAIYPGHLSVEAGSVELVPDIRDHITAQTPPTFLLQNEDDPVDRVEHSVSYFLGLKRAGVPVEMHIYSEGGHAFGLRRTKYPATEWPSLVEKWLATIGMISE